MDIGTLTGVVSIEDQLTDHLTDIANHVRHFADEFEGAMGVMAISVGVLTAAVAGAVVSITELGEKGSTILGVEQAFDRLAESAGTTGQALRDALMTGVKGTIDDFDLMRTTARLLGSGMQLTASQAQLMGQAARELGKATGTDATQGLETLSSALTTGRVRGLQQQIGLIDLAKGEQEFAKSVGLTVDQLTEEGKLQGKRIAILQATQAYVDRLGDSQVSFKERLKQAEVAVDEWVDSLAKSVATSPHVSAALDSIGAAIQKTFGGTGQSALETIVGWINSFADSVASIAPTVISTIGKIADGVKSIYNFLSEHSEVIKSAAIAVTAYVTAWAALTIGSSIVNGVIAGLQAIGAAATLLEAGSLLTLISPIGLVAGAVAGLTFAVYKFYQQLDEVRTLPGTPFQNVTDGAGKALIAIDQVDEKLKDLKAGQNVTEGLTIDLSGSSARAKQGKSPVDYLKDQSKEIEAATSASIAKTAELWDTYFTTIDKMNGDSLNAKLEANDRWYTQSKMALDKTRALNSDYWNQLDALDNAYYAKAAAVRDEYAEKTRQTYIYIETETAKVAQKANDDFAKQREAQLKATNANLLSLVDAQLSYTKKTVEDGGDQLAVEWADALNKLGPPMIGFEGQWQRTVDAIDGYFEKKMQDRALQRDAEAWGREIANSWETGFQTILNDFPSQIANALTGGGGISGGLSAVASQVGALFGKKMFDVTSPVNGLIASGLSHVIGDSAAGALSVALPGIGSAIGSLVGPLIGMIANIGGPSQDELAARDKFKSIQLAGESLADTIQRVSNELIAAGKTGPEALAMVQRALDATHDSAGAVEGALGDINKVLDDQKQKQADLNDAVQRYNFSMEELGPTMQAQKLDEQATQLAKDWDVLVDSGMNMATVNSHMASSMNDYLQTAVKTGHDVPEAMKPIIESMIDQGLFLDANGNKITDLKDLGLTFSMSMSDGFKLVADKLQTLLEGLGLVPKALDDIATAGVDMATAVGDAISKIPKEIPVSFTVAGGAPAAGGASYQTMLDKWYTLPFEQRINTNFDDWMKTNHASMGGRVTSTGVSYYASGGNVLTPAFQPQGTDTVPIMATPGETIQSVDDSKSTAANLKALEATQRSQAASLAAMQRLLMDQPRAIAVAVTDAALLMRRTA